MDRRKISLDMWEDMPRDMKKYLKNYGYHFNKKICEFAVSKMYKQDKNGGKKEKIQMVEKDKVHELLKKYNITIENDTMYDSVYVYCMAMSDFFGKSLPNEQYVMMYVRDVIEDVDKPDGYIFNRWYADMCFGGEGIDWEEFI